MEDEQQEGSFLYHTACLNCESSDGLALYEKEDENGNTYQDGFCWVCHSYFSPKRLSGESLEVAEVSDTSTKNKLTVDEVKEFKTSGSRKRKIKKDAMETYGVKMEFNEDGSVRAHYYPVTKKGELTGYKPRILPKNFKVSQVGDTKAKGADLFGQHVFESGKVQVNKKFLCITEGELDAVALYQVLEEKGNPAYKNAVVSINSGAGSALKSIQENWKWINTFEQVILFFDQDEEGKKAALKVAKALPLGKCKLAKFSEKDTCEMIKQGKEDELYNAFWKSETYAPEGVLAGNGLWNLITTPLTASNAHYPWEGLDNMLHGIRPAEMVTLTAGSGIAKSSFARMIAHHLQRTTNDNVGMIFLEESVKKTGLQLMSLEAGKLLHLPETVYEDDEFRDAYDKTLGTGQYYFFDDFASQDFDAVADAIMYMARASNCKYIFLDHISMLVSGGDSGDERKALDSICTKLRTMVQQLDITLFAITHLKRPNGVAHEEGAQTSISQLRGSAGIAQLSDAVIGFERNTQAEDPIERNTTHVRVLKDRFGGNVGPCCSLLYDKDTGLAKELSEDEVAEMDTSSEFDDLEGFGFG